MVGLTILGIIFAVACLIFITILPIFVGVIPAFICMVLSFVVFGKAFIKIDDHDDGFVMFKKAFIKIDDYDDEIVDALVTKRQSGISTVPHTNSPQPKPEKYTECPTCHTVYPEWNND